MKDLALAIEKGKSARPGLPDVILDLSSDMGEFMVGTKSLVLASESNKRNPNSLRFLIGLLINAEFAGNRSVAADEIGKAPTVYASERQGKEGKRLTNRALGDILNDDVHISYWQIEALAHHVGMPVGAFLLLSRLASHVRDDGDLADADIEGTIRFIEILKRVRSTKKITGADLRAIADCYPRAVQRHLFKGE